jgi:hypothetical protein
MGRRIDRRRNERNGFVELMGRTPRSCEMFVLLLVEFCVLPFLSGAYAPAR